MKLIIRPYRSLRNITRGAAAIYFVLTSAQIATAVSPTDTSFGANAGFSITTGVDDTAIGNSALRFTTTGSGNTAVGSQALKTNASGINNTALGFGALQFNLQSGNTAVGRVALYSNSDGQNNVAIGSAAMYATTSGSLNTALGTQALRYNTTGASNVASGNQALFSNTSGGFNVALGDGALLNNTTGSGNIGIGDDGGYNLTIGNNNISIGNKGVAGESGVIRIGSSPMHTDIFLTGIIHGNGSGLTGVPVTAANLGLPLPLTKTTASGSAILSATNTTGNGLAGSSSSGNGLVGVSISGTGVYGSGGLWAGYFSGNVATTGNLAVTGGPSWTSNHWLGSIVMNNGSAIGWKVNSSGQAFGLGHTDSGLCVFRTTSDPGPVASGASYDLLIGNTGTVGVGTINPNPSYRLDVAGDTQITSGSGSMQFGSPNAETGMSILRSRPPIGLVFFPPNRADVRFDGSTLKLLAGTGTAAMPSTNGIAINTSGNVGIGTVSPIVKLDLVGSGILESRVASVNERAILSLDSTFGSTRRVWTMENGLFGTAGLFGIYDRTANRAGLTIDTAGVVSVGVLRITGGADLAEPFQMKESELEKGSVVVIDDEHPGRLKRCARAYDTRVAGIVSGANGVNPGIALHQEGVVDGGQNVALSGRVYVLAETSGGAIRPGDLLTTSDIPGRAMKVVDHTKAQGAIIGKAMSSLGDGTGMVLVLVTLQ